MYLVNQHITKFAFINGRVCINHMWFGKVLIELQVLILSSQEGSRKLHEEIAFHYVADHFL